MPDASSLPETDDARPAFARLLADLAARGALDRADPLAGGILAGLRALAQRTLGPSWRRHHLGDGPVAAAPLCAPTPAAVQTAYGQLLALAVAWDKDGQPQLTPRPFARQQAGAYYTPPALITLLLDWAGVDAGTRALIDPACGPGAFLLAAQQRMPADRLYGIDVDPCAVACARVALALRLRADGAPAPDLTDRIVCADALLDDRAWAALTPAGPAAPGFDAIVGNPPWERAKLQQVEWLAAHDPGFRGLDAGQRKQRLATLAAADTPLWRAFDAERRRRAAYAARLRARYPEACGGDANLYAGFAALADARIAPDGRAALLVPSGIAADRGTHGLVRRLASAGRLAAFLDFENRGPGRTQPGTRFFPGVDGRFRFAALCLTGRAGRVRRSRLAFALSDPGDLGNARPLTLSPRALATLNPATGGLAMPRCRADAALALRLHRRWPPLVDRRGPAPVHAFPARYRRMFDLTNDAQHFQPWPRADGDAWPLYEGKMVQAFDHRAASVVTHAGNLKRPAQPRRTTEAERADPAFRPTPRFGVAADQARWPDGLDWAIALKHVTSPSNARTVIAAAVPPCAAANSLPLLLPADDDPAAVEAYRRTAPLLLANLNAQVLDWLARGKLQGQNLNLYILEQLPVIPPGAYPADAAAHVRAALKQLCHTSYDLNGFARDLGHPGPPVAWCPSARAQARHALDALYRKLYALDARQSVRVVKHFRVTTQN
ncbi:N-6 DNA methylase [Rhodovibrio sodomensis]|uniref:N-6 DNA methylase n=1 Tax=Rhodovibrio sodomensis TaxID=1088 RepID=UPI001903EF91|nr:N-6 DNA methylase [Rhodovibrio sodomensis]